LDKEKKIAILTVDGIILDQFDVKEKDRDLKDTDYILYESEMKYRFRNLMPHYNVLKPSIKVFFKSIGYSLTGFAVVWFLAYHYYHIFLFWL
jgi:hypothetical protein